LPFHWPLFIGGFIPAFARCCFCIARHSLRSACSLPYRSRTPARGGYANLLVFTSPMAPSFLPTLYQIPLFPHSRAPRQVRTQQGVRRSATDCNPRFHGSYIAPALLRRGATEPPAICDWEIIYLETRLPAALTCDRSRQAETQFQSGCCPSCAFHAHSVIFMSVKTAVNEESSGEQA